jgi:hypothetical protein
MDNTQTISQSSEIQENMENFPDATFLSLNYIYQPTVVDCLQDFLFRMKSFQNIELFESSYIFANPLDTIPLSILHQPFDYSAALQYLMIIQEYQQVKLQEKHNYQLQLLKKKHEIELKNCLEDCKQSVQSNKIHIPTFIKPMFESDMLIRAKSFIGYCLSNSAMNIPYDYIVIIGIDDN